MRRIVATFAGSAVGFLGTLLTLTANNGFTPVPWQHDDYNNLVACIPPLNTVRPVSTLVIHAIAFLGPKALFGAIIGLVIAAVALSVEFAWRWVGIRLMPRSALAVSAAAGILTALSEYIAYVVRYTGNFTHLLSYTVAVLAILTGLSFIDGKPWRLAPFSVLYLLAIFAKEDVPAFVFTSIALYAALQYAAAPDRAIVRRAATAIAVTVGCTIVALYCNLASSSFITVTLKGKGGYGLATSPSDVVMHIVDYLTIGWLLPTVEVLYLASAVCWLIPRSKLPAARFLCLSPVVLAVVIPYALLKGDHMYPYYTIMWVALTSAAAVLGASMIGARLGIPGWAVALVSVGALGAIAVKSKPERDHIAAWISGHQTQNARIIEELERHAAELSGADRVWVRGIDQGFSPFFYTDGRFMNQRLGTPQRVWTIIVSPGSFVANAYALSGLPRVRPHVVIADETELGATPPKPLIEFDTDLRARFLR